MGVLNPDLLSKDMDSVLNDAVNLRKTYNQQNLQPELLLLAMLRRPDTAAMRLFQIFRSNRGVDLEKLTRQVELAVQTRRDNNGNLDFTAAGNVRVPLSRQMIIMLDEALSVANAMNEVRIDTDHALKVLSESSMSTSGILRQVGITPKAIDDIQNDSSQVLPIKRSSGAVQDFVATAKRGNMRAVHFREDLLREIINVANQNIKRHIILLGPDGVGKRTLAYSLALLIAEGKGPSGFKSLVRIDETALLDDELQAVRAGLNQARGGILFIPHIHRFFGGPVKAEFTKTTPIIQKAFLGDDPVLIVSTSEQEYNQRLANVSAIKEHSTIIRVPEPSPEEALEMLRTLKPHIEAAYEVRVDDEALRVAVNLAKRYLTAMPLPLSAEQLLHRSAAMVNMSNQPHLAFRPTTNDDGVVDVEDVTLTASQITGVPVSKLGEDERLRYASMVEYLSERVIGQEEAVMVVSRAIKAARVGLKDAKRPIGAFLFLGPTGVGKTELARVLAEFMFGSEDAMLPLDMSEFKDESSINRLIGSPIGYVGSEDGGQLTERVRQQPYIIVLFDEVEKAHPRIMDLLLQVIEEGRLTDGRGNTTRFSEAVIILTSNIGAQHLAVPVLDDDIKDAVMEEVRGFLRPEFINRLDEVVMFNALDDESMAKILRLLLKKETRMAEERGLTLSFSDSAITYLLNQRTEEDRGMGARPLKRIIRRQVREPLADFLLKAAPPAGTLIQVTTARKKGGALKFSATIDGKEIAIE
ncbi:MAG: ATP-dependent Clp protease ATP-binding subunit [Anaerolineae bacterium]|nr:ATP-dependent Clp protease ATP-binding subunit [Anaerolineae bacterium]MDW8171532.1 ATP-dependent Clp protease ATP-binding subunit [Anaerolineae bacterium]